MRYVSCYALAVATLLTGCIADKPQALGPVASPIGAASLPGSAARCEGLAALDLKGGKIDRAERVAGGAIVKVDPGTPGMPTPKAFCRVQATLTPVPGSNIRIELWLPEQAVWNGKLLGAGNGGFGGSLIVPSYTMRHGLSLGYATVGNDTGHVTAGQPSVIDASWAMGAPEAVKDYGWRADHVTAEAAKQLILRYYDRRAAASYFHGCSNGGREALMLAQRFPADYDAIVAGAPAIPWTGLASTFAANASILQNPLGNLTLEKLKLLQTASLKKCDALDGVRDGVIENPRACNFDPAELACKQGDGASCLTNPQVNTAKQIYNGYKGLDGTRIGVRSYPGFAPGAEADPGTWQTWITSNRSAQSQFSTHFFRYLVHRDPEWQLSQFDPVRDYELAKSRVGDDLDAADPNLAPFFRRGGKLFLYHGWNDAAIPPGVLIDYYEEVLKANPRAAANSVRLFMVPGMSHCSGGPGPSVFDTIGTLDSWYQGGPAPERVVATKYENLLFAYMGLPTKTERTRPLCAFPKVAKWDGKGSTDDAASFKCEAPGK